VITAVAHVPDVEQTVTSDLKRAGNVLLLLGRSLPEFGASHVAMALNEAPNGNVPTFDPDSPARYRTLHEAIRAGLVAACHDCAEGGAAVAIAEMAIGGRLGVHMSTIADASVVMFGESLGRLVVEVASEHVDEMVRLFPTSTALGTVTQSPMLVLPDGSSCTLESAVHAWTSAP